MRLWFLESNKSGVGTILLARWPGPAGPGPGRELSEPESQFGTVWSLLKDGGIDRGRSKYLLWQFQMKSSTTIDEGRRRAESPPPESAWRPETPSPADHARVWTAAGSCAVLRLAAA